MVHLLDNSKKLPPLSKEEAELLSGDGDDRSVEEAKAFSKGSSYDDLRKKAEEKEIDRTEYFRDHFEKVAIITMYAIWIILIATGFIWAFHLLAPNSWHWLSAEQVKALQTVVTGGALAGVASGHLRKRVG